MAVLERALVVTRGMSQVSVVSTNLSAVSESLSEWDAVGDALAAAAHGEVMASDRGWKLQEKEAWSLARTNFD